MNDFYQTQDYQYIKDKILDYLSIQDYSEAKLLQKVLLLKQRYPKTKRYKNYTKPNIEFVIKRLVELKVIDEIRFLENLIYSSLASKYGIKKIQQKMYIKMYKRSNIEKILAKYNEDKPEKDFTKITTLTKFKKDTLLRKYPNESTYDIDKRLFNFIAQKGFEYEEIKEIISTVSGKQ